MDLHDAARLLGVHYQTAYKWVRSGELPAVMVRGRYRIDSKAVESAGKRRDAPAKPRPLQPRAGGDQLRSRIYSHLVAGNEREARKQIARLLDEGWTLSSAAQEFLVPALRRIGEEWSNGQVSVAVEHRASATVERIVGEHHPAPRGRRRGTAVVATPSGERHSLPALLATVALREDNWHVHHLGADIPLEDLVDFCAAQGVDLAVLTVTTPSNERAAVKGAEMLLRVGVPALVGRPDATLDDLRRLARESRAAAV